MTQPRDRSRFAPDPFLLGAYVDGELDPVQRADVESWLQIHPEMHEQAERLRRLADLWRATSPPNPGEAVWKEVWHRIDAQMTSQRARKEAGFRLLRGIGRILVPLVAAAAVLLAVVLGYPSRPGHVSVGVADDVFPVVTADEVEIISIENGGHAMLIVGRPPLADPIVLVGPADMGDIQIKPDSDGMIPTIAQPVVGGSTVIVVAPLAWSGNDDKGP